MQGLRFKQDLTELGWLDVQPPGIFEQPVPGGVHVGDERMITGTSQAEVFAMRALAERIHLMVGFDERGKPEFAISIEQLNLADLAQVKTHRVFR